MNINERKKKLGAKIKASRESQNLSLRHFAKMIGIGYAYLSDVEQGKRNIGFENLCKIAEGLGMDIGELTDGIGSED